MADVIIVGAGPAGMFAALELSRSKADILVIDQEKDVSDRVCPVKKKYHRPPLSEPPLRFWLPTCPEA